MDEGGPKRGLLAKLKHVFRPGGLSQEQFEEEIQDLLDQGAETGVISPSEGEMIQSIFEFGETVAREIMTPRTAIAGVSSSAPLGEVIKTVLAEGYSRLPVYTGDIDHIEGVLIVKDLLTLWGSPPEATIPPAIIRPPLFVPLSKKIGEILSELRHRKSHMTFVLDEYGGIAGLITLEDIIEEIIGDIHDEYDHDEETIIPRNEGVWLADGQASIHDLRQLLGRDLPDSEYETISGFLTGFLGRVPKAQETIVWEDVTFIILAADERKIRQLEVCLGDAKPDAAPPEAPDGPAEPPSPSAGKNSGPSEGGAGNVPA